MIIILYIKIWKSKKALKEHAKICALLYFPDFFQLIEIYFLCVPKKNIYTYI